MGDLGKNQNWFIKGIVHEKPGKKYCHHQKAANFYSELAIAAYAHFSFSLYQNTDFNNAFYKVSYDIIINYRGRGI